MTENTTIVPIRPLSRLPASDQAALAAELAKCLKLVASASMNADHQTVWLAAAVDALEDIRATEVAHVSAEVRRTITRPAQIVPEIARLVAEHRAARTPQPVRAALPPLPPRPPAPPLSRAELDSMSPQAVSLGLKYGFLERVNGKLVEVTGN